MPVPTQAEFDSRVRELALAWLALVSANDALNATADAMLAAGVIENSGWMRRASISIVADNSLSVDFARELVRRGVVTREEAAAVFPLT
jgi:hypothetical protein